MEAKFIGEALEAAGCRVLKAADPHEAPLTFQTLTPGGEILELVCYVFRANKYKQARRPVDEHRFQVKYGSDFTRYHELFIADERNRVTLFFGAHLEEGLFVAADPTMHNPTWFSRSVEFKDEHVQFIHDTGWYGWERPRSMARRKQVLPAESFQTEVLLGFEPEFFWQYIQLERAATGMDPGERLLLIDRLAELRPAEATVHHPLEAELGLSAREILDLIDGAFRLKVAVRGGTAEKHLLSLLQLVPGMDEVEQLDQDGRPDFRVVYRGGAPVFIECKNVLRRRQGERIKVDFQRTRASKHDPCSRYYSATEFEILAACLHPVTEEWSYRFRLTSALEPHAKCNGRLSQHVYVNGGWVEGVEEVLESFR